VRNLAQIPGVTCFWRSRYPARRLRKTFSARGSGLYAIRGSPLFILAMLSSAAFGLFPYVLSSHAKPDYGLTVYNAAAAHCGRPAGCGGGSPGMLLAYCYSVCV
jgi:hypothetical protein